MAVQMSKRSLVLAFTGLAFLHFSVSLDLTALTVALPKVARDLHASTVEIYWAGTAFMLSSAVLQPVFAALSHAFGRHAMIMFVLVLFAVGTIVCAISNSIAVLLAGRAMQGAGAGGMQTLSSIIVVDLFPLRRRPIVMGLIALFWVVGLTFGPIMGGGFSSYVSWRWIFWFVLPLAGIAFVLLAAFLRTPHRPEHPLQALKNFDWPGAVLFVASLTSFLMGITWGGTQFPWSSFRTIVPLVLGVVGLASFALFERSRRKPMIPLAILNQRTTAICFIGYFLMGIVQFEITYFLPLYFEVAKGYSALGAGAVTYRSSQIPITSITGLTSAFMGATITKIGQYRPIIWFGWTIVALGSGLLVVLDKDTNPPAWFFATLPFGIGVGSLFASLPIGAMAPQTPANQPMSVSLSVFSRTVGNGFGVAIGNAIYQNVLKHDLLSSSDPVLRSEAPFISQNADLMRIFITTYPNYPPGILSRRSSSSMAGEAAMAIGDQLQTSDSLTNTGRADLEAAFIHSIRVIWWSALGIALLGGLLSLFVRNHTLGGHTAKPAETTTEDSVSERDSKLENGHDKTDVDSTAGRSESKLHQPESVRQVDGQSSLS